MFSTLLDLLFILAPAWLLAMAAPSGAKDMAPSLWLSLISTAGCGYLVLFWSLWQAIPGILPVGTRPVNAATPEHLGIVRLTSRLLGLALWNRRRQGLQNWIAAILVLEEDKARKSLTRIIPELA